MVGKIHDWKCELVYEERKLYECNGRSYKKEHALHIREMDIFRFYTHINAFLLLNKCNERFIEVLSTVES